MTVRLALFAALACLASGITPVSAEFQAGVALTDITPKQWPVIVNGGFISRMVDKAKHPLNARSFAFSDGKETIVMVIVDTCMMSRPMIDQVKSIASDKSGIPTDRILISATHTHSAPSAMGCLGVDEDPAYVPFLTKRLVDAVLAAVRNLQPARIGWGEIDAGDYTASRRWVIRPDRMRKDPFGNTTVRANMYAGAQWEDTIGPSGPEDPILSVLSIQTSDGKPLGAIGNFSMHYYGDQDISPDYYGLFSEGLKKRLAPDDPQFVAAMSHGCSGDTRNLDFEKSPTRGEGVPPLAEYAERLVDLAVSATTQTDHHRPASISMDESRFTLRYRVPDQQRLEWAQKIVQEMGDRLPQNQTEVYAREQVILHERQHTEVVLQVLRLGEDIALATTPNETYALTGLKIKAASPFAHTMVISLANGGDGYIPPPEQHLLGGYNTWPARTAGLEVRAEPVIAETSLQMLEKAAGRHRIAPASPESEASAAILAAKPVAYYRLDEVTGPVARDASPHSRHAYYEPQVLFHLPGPETFDGKGFQKRNRAAHFAGHRLRADLPELAHDYRFTLHFWNGMPNDGRETTGWIFSRGRDHHLGDEGDHLGIGGTSGHTGKLIFFHGDDPSSAVAGTTSLERWTWYRLDFSRKGDRIQVHLDGKLEIETNREASFPTDLRTLFFGGRCDNQDNFEGRLDEIAIYLD